MKKERNIGDIIDRVIALLDEEGDEGLRKRLTRAKERAVFRAPEAMPALWHDVSVELTRSMPKDHGNYARIAAIWNDTEAKP